MTKSIDEGGFGSAPGFPILSDRALTLSMDLGVARDCGVPACATFIVDWEGSIRYMAAQRTDLPRSVGETLRLLQAFRASDLIGEALPDGWSPGGETVPVEFTRKIAYFKEKYGREEGSSEVPSSAAPASKAASPAPFDTCITIEEEQEGGMAPSSCCPVLQVVLLLLFILWTALGYAFVIWLLANPPYEIPYGLSPAVSLSVCLAWLASGPGMVYIIYNFMPLSGQPVYVPFMPDYMI
jgi:hypothetical protein